MNLLAAELIALPEGVKGVSTVNVSRPKPTERFYHKSLQVSSGQERIPDV